MYTINSGSRFMSIYCTALPEKLEEKNQLWVVYMKVQDDNVSMMIKVQYDILYKMITFLISRILSITPHPSTVSTLYHLQYCIYHISPSILYLPHISPSILYLPYITSSIVSTVSHLQYCIYSISPPVLYLTCSRLSGFRMSSP